MDVLLLLALILSASFGAGLLLVPGLMLAPFGATLAGLASGATRLLGTALLAFALMAWQARRSGSGELKRCVVNALFAYYLLSSLVLLEIQLSGLLNAAGWSLVATHVAFTIAFGRSVLKG